VAELEDARHLLVNLASEDAQLVCVSRRGKLARLLVRALGRFEHARARFFDRFDRRGELGRAARKPPAFAVVHQRGDLLRNDRRGRLLRVQQALDAETLLRYGLISRQYRPAHDNALELK
jgi:hypothetical protein